MACDDKDSSFQVALQEENFVLKTQVAKLQVALKTARNQQKDGRSTVSQTEDTLYVSKQQLEVVMGELAELRLQVSQLHEENRSLQAQLQHVREAQLASASSSGTTDFWEAPSPHPDDADPASRDPVKRSDMAFIEREINCLKQKISETRLKLQAAEPTTPNENEYRAGLVGDRRAGLAVPQRQPLQRKQAAAGRSGGGAPALAAQPAQQRLGAVALSFFGELPPRCAASRPSSATGSAFPSVPRTRPYHGQSGKKVAKKQAKENASSQHAGANLPSRPKVQRGRGFAY